MGHERHYFAVSIFFIGAACLIATLIYFLYSHQKFDKSHTFVMMFKGSLSGLSVGSAVTYRGVRIGLIKKIELTENQKTGAIQIPVYVQFYMERTYINQKNPVLKLIRQGWKASITKPNLLTGNSNIALQQNGAQPTKVRYFKGYSVFPTVPAVDKERSLDKTLKAAEQTLKDISNLVSSKEMKNTIDAARLMALSFNRLATSIDRKLPTLVSHFNDALQQITMAAYAHKTLTDYLSRNPESFIMGKRG